MAGRSLILKINSPKTHLRCNYKEAPTLLHLACDYRKDLEFYEGLEEQDCVLVEFRVYSEIECEQFVALLVEDLVSESGGLTDCQTTDQEDADEESASTHQSALSMGVKLNRNRLSPFGGSPGRFSRWKAYIDEWVQTGAYPARQDAEIEVGSGSFTATAMKVHYGPEGWNALGNRAKDVFRAPNAKLFGFMSYGDHGRCDLAPGVAIEIIVLLQPFPVHLHTKEVAPDYWRKIRQSFCSFSVASAPAWIRSGSWPPGQVAMSG